MPKIAGKHNQHLYDSEFQAEGTLMLKAFMNNTYTVHSANTNSLLDVMMSDS